MFSFKNSTLPFKFNNFFLLNSQIHNYNTRNAQSFRLPLCRTNTGKFLIYFQGPNFYNSLNSDITSSPSSASFKRILRDRWRTRCLNQTLTLKDDFNVSLQLRVKITAALQKSKPKQRLMTRKRILDRRLETKIEVVGDEIAKVKIELGESINHIEESLRHDVDLTWDYAVNNEQYSRKNNIRTLGVDEEPDENLECKFIEVIKENLDEEIKPEEIEIIHRIGRPGRTDNGERDRDQRSTPPATPRPVIVKFLSNKTKMRILLKRRQLKGKKIVI